MAARTDDARFEPLWQSLDAQVASGRLPGYVTAVRAGGSLGIRAGGRQAVEADSAPMTERSLFRIASLTKPMGGVLTLSLMQDGVLSLDDPVARWLPELAEPRVLVAPEAALDQTVPAESPITVRHLLTCTAGWGVVMQRTPLQAALFEQGVHPGPLTPQMSGDEFLSRIASLPLAFQPGDGWLYDTPIDVLGILLARATGKSLSQLFDERVFGPLGMTESSFWTPDVERLTTAYSPIPEGLEVLDAADGLFCAPPPFEELSSGLVSTAGDVLRFFSAMADGGAPVLTAGSLSMLTADALTDAQRAQASPILGPGETWGLATAVDLEAAEPWMAPGRWGWTGGTGTTAYVDPVRETVAVLLTQRGMFGPDEGFEYFWSAVAQAA